MGDGKESLFWRGSRKHRMVGQTFGLRGYYLHEFVAGCVTMDIERIADMATKKKPAAVAGNDQEVWKGFVPYRMTSADKTQFKAWLDTGEYDLVECISRIVLDGFKLTVRYLRDRDSYTASLTGGAGSDGWQGYTHTSFASDPETAIALAYFKLNVLWADKNSPDQLEQANEEFG